MITLVLTACAPASPFAPDDSATTAEALASDATLQGWSRSARDFFHRQSSGAVFLPLTWWAALEEPTGPGHMLEGPVIERFGLIPDAASPDGLPVGFAKTRDPNGNDLVALNCAACHTARMRYKGKSLTVEGGAGMADIVGYTDELFASVVATDATPTRYMRFATNVLGPAAGDPAAQAALKAAFTPVAQQLKTLVQLGEQLGLYPVKEGPGRVDAITRAANITFGPFSLANFHKALAPVSIPPLWNTPRFDWQHYSGSTRQPLGRNTAQAIGAGAPVLFAPGDQQFVSGVDIVALHKFEDQLRQLEPPVWPQFFGRIDRTKARRGRTVYEHRCEGCHEPSTTTDGQLVLTAIPIAALGTDPMAADQLAESRIDASAIGFGANMKATDAFAALTSSVLDRKFRDLAFTEDQIREFTDGRENHWRAPRAYRALPLDGMWATAPYLHNGSVPNLYQLLVPAARRDKTFFVGGNRDFDPKRVGFETSCGDGTGVLVDTTIRGNSNAGHEYGVDLSDRERYELIEYLKTR